MGCLLVILGFLIIPANMVAGLVVMAVGMVYHNNEVSR